MSPVPEDHPPITNSPEMIGARHPTTDGTVSGTDKEGLLDREYFTLIGECYVDGKMEGEAIDNLVYDGYEQDFYLT